MHVRASGLRLGTRTWRVGSLIRAIADSLEARFNPVTVEGEISGFSRASSGHCYFSLKDEDGQVRCAMFRRAASLLDFTPRDGQRVELRGRLGVYEPRGELQLVAEIMREAGPGNLFEQFLKLKAKLEAEGLFDAARKRPLPQLPKAVGVVTSLGAAALHDVISALKRRAPHIQVIVYPANVQGDLAPAQLRDALLSAYQRSEVDVLLLIRGGGAIEDLWSFNDEQLARIMMISPVPIVSGVGHETDFTIADFCADVRAPTPTAAAELCAQPQQTMLDVLFRAQSRLEDFAERQLEASSQRLDLASARLNRPSHFVTRQHARLEAVSQRLPRGQIAAFERLRSSLATLGVEFPKAIRHSLQQRSLRLANAELRLGMLNPQLVLKRGYAWLADEHGKPISSISQTRKGQAVRATLADGEVDMTVSPPKLI